MNGDVVLSHWWWLLFGLLSVAALMVALRSWLQSHQRMDLGYSPVRLGLMTAQEDEWAMPPDLAQSAASTPLAAWLEPSQPPMVLAKQALEDSLTGLSTRLNLEDQLAAAAMRAESRQRRIALLYIDLDGFKPVNDSHGYGAGDRLLREMGQRLLTIGRTTDAVARMGGDEFLMLLDGDPDRASAALVADRVRHALQAPCVIDGRDVSLCCSIGIVLYPDHGPRAKLIARADAAMLAAKQAGGNMHCFFDERMDSDAQGAIDLQRDLRHALDMNEGLSLHYQPKINGRTGHIMGVEALLRWQHPVKGMLSPAVFVPVAERFGLIGKLGQWVTDEACRQVRAWMDAGLQMRVAINLSVHQLRQADLVDKVQQSLQRHQVPPELVTFEVTESAAMEDAKASLRIFDMLAQIRVSLSIDGVGTGYSSLNYLRKLPAKQLKIDRSFVQDVDREGDAQAIVRAVIKLSHALGLEVVAEGVETEAQQLVLQRMGCDQLQGYLYARPMAADPLYKWATGPDLPQHKPSFQQAQFDCDVAPERLAQTPANPA